MMVTAMACDNTGNTPYGALQGNDSERPMGPVVRRYEEIVQYPVWEQCPELPDAIRFRNPESDTGTWGPCIYPGPKGRDGATGSQGAAGAQGARGEQGPQGPAGVDGRLRDGAFSCTTLMEPVTVWNNGGPDDFTAESRMQCPAGTFITAVTGFITQGGWWGGDGLLHDGCECALHGAPLQLQGPDGGEIPENGAGCHCETPPIQAGGDVAYMQIRCCG